MIELIFASHNNNKAQEIEKKMASVFKINTLDDIGIHEEIIENGLTLRENAIIKAEFVYEKTNKDCFADDTGLMVEVLNGEPGVYSARYAGKDKIDNNNMDLLLKNLNGKENRKAKFVSVICLIYQGVQHMIEGELQGKIIDTKRGNHGFGYDPIFVPDGYEITLAEMGMDEKNKISHRAKAIDKMKILLESLSNNKS
ncbi:MAG: RdgB/HAM1 family non-canonical purine NTP pyrophosphatase [Bacteroidetes bacterium]|nr:RdgB/HAM1 family non-canonical purine NTP pyrophosphatase [Bacteroidota bacterium]